MKSKLDERLTELEAMATSFGDTDAEWWPFAFLRPQPHERIGTGRS